MRTSIYLNKDRQAAVEASGLSLLDIIDRGLASVEAFGPPPAPTTSRAVTVRPACPPHPRGRVTKGFCGRCGRQTEGEKIT
jgi:hypothetical protein